MRSYLEVCCVSQVYWYDRERDKLTRLWCSDRRTPLTKLALVETVDLMLAAGSEAGVVTVFQIPKPVDAALFPMGEAGRGEPPAKEESDSAPVKPSGGALLGVGIAGAEMFTISGTHQATVTALEWSRNGMRLFSGDVQGKVGRQ